MSALINAIPAWAAETGVVGGIVTVAVVVLLWVRRRLNRDPRRQYPARHSPGQPATQVPASRPRHLAPGEETGAYRREGPWTAA